MTDYVQNAKKLTTDLNTLYGTNNFVFIKPNDSTTGDNTNTCYAPSEYTGQPTLNMVPINTALNTPSTLHTPQSCATNAAIIQQKNELIQNKTLQSSKKKPGLFYNLVNGYYANEPTFFVNSTPITNGISTDFSEINQITTSSPNTKFSIEWTGYFIPKQNGSWTFTINTVDASVYIWLGHVAINEYTITNSIVNSNTKTITLHNIIANKFIPIRIQYGYNVGNPTFNLTITDSNNIQQAISKVLFTINADGKFSEQLITYYALSKSTTESTLNGLYNCYVSNPDVGTYTQLREKENYYKYTQVGSIINETTEYNLLDPTNYLTWDGKNIIFGNLTNSKILSASNSGKILLEDDGTLHIQNDTTGTDTTGKIITGNWSPVTMSLNATKQTPTTKDANLMWSKYKFVNNISNHIIIPKNYKITNTIPTILISNNNLYKLEITSKGNLIIKQSIYGCPGIDTTTKTAYTSGTAFQPYKSSSSSLIGQMGLQNINDKTIMLTDASVMKPANLYTQYNGYIPNTNEIKNAKPIDFLANTPQNLCNSDPTCLSYHTFNKASQKYYVAHTSSTPEFIPNAANSNISSGQLYIRDMSTNFSQNDERYKIPIINTLKISDYDKYTTLPGTLSSAKCSGLKPALIDEINTHSKFMRGTTECFSNYTEGFDNHGYDTNALPSAGVPDQGNAIIQGQTIPIQGMLTDYAGQLNQVKSNQYDLTTNINTYYTLASELYMDSYGPNKYDFLKTTTLRNKKPTLNDALNEDVNTMILRQNEMYAYGSIAVATLLIAAIYIIK